MNIKQSVINTFNRMGIDYKALLKENGYAIVYNRFGAGSCETTPLIGALITWVYDTSKDYERGIFNVRIDDFDRVRYFILEQDKNAYYTCID